MNSKQSEAQLHDMKIGDEPFLTFLMPVSLFVFYTSRLRDADLLLEHVLFFAGWQWLLSLKNVVIGPMKKDTGIIQWAVLIGAAYFKSRLGILLMSVAVGISNGAVGLFILSHKPWKNHFIRAARYFKKSTFWAKTFTAYLLASSVLWFWIAFDIHSSPEAKFL